MGDRKTRPHTAMEGVLASIGEVQLEASRQAHRAAARLAVERLREVERLQARVNQLESGGAADFHLRFMTWTEQTLLPALMERIGPMVQHLLREELIAAEQKNYPTRGDWAPGDPVYVHGGAPELYCACGLRVAGSTLEPGPCPECGQRLSFDPTSCLDRWRAMCDEAMAKVEALTIERDKLLVPGRATDAPM